MVTEYDLPLVKTRGHNGDERLWGACEVCGHVEELAPRTAYLWLVDPACEVCKDERPYVPSHVLDIERGIPPRSL